MMPSIGRYQGAHLDVIVVVIDELHPLQRDESNVLCSTVELLRFAGHKYASCYDILVGVRGQVSYGG